MQEHQKSLPPNCRICLGALEFPRNLVQPDYKHLKQILNQILGYEIPSAGGVFNICFSCENKLTWILEFKDLCEKSLNSLQEVELKKEDSESEDRLSIPDNDNDTDYNPEVILTNDGTEASNKRKKRSKSSDKGGQISKSLANVKLRRTQYKQYSATAVIQALNECNNYKTDAKTRTCIYCNFEGATSTVLSVHMHRCHSDLTTNWCNRCNVQTESLEMHRIQTQCTENRCKFCSRKCKNITELGKHLKVHCHSFFKNPDAYKRYVVKPDGESPTLIFFKEDPFGENTDFVDTLREEMKGANEKILKKQLQRISSNVSSKNIYYEDCEEDGDGKRSTTKPKKCRNRHQQFPFKDVEMAIKDTMKSYHTNRKCIECGAKARNGQLLSVHMNKMHKDTRGKWCLKCNEMVDNLEEHFKQHVYKCIFCHQVSKNIAALKTHLVTHSRNNGAKLNANWICCKRCHNVFPTKDVMKEHKCKKTRSKDKITSVKLVIKDVNNDDTDSDDALPIRSDTVKSRYKQFPAEEVQAAIYDTMKSYRENRRCILCGHLAPQLRSLSLHMSQMHKDVVDKWCCKCNSLSENIKEHKDSHKNDLLKCKFCEKRYAKTLYVRMHMKLHAQSKKMDTELRYFYCKKCPKSYQSDKELKEHDCEAKTDHEESKVKLKTCRICGAKCPDLRVHMKLAHKGPKQRLCPICGKVFARNYAMTVHVRTHTGEKPFKCSFCDKQFNVRRSLQVHERRHIGEKRHICHICAKAFVTSAELKTHSRIHESGSVVEQCPVCEKKFYKSSVLQTHMKKHRGFEATPSPSTSAVHNVQEVAAPPVQMEIAKNPADPIQMFFAHIF